MKNSKIKICAIPDHVKIVLSHIEEKGHLAYLVGGCVRDAIIGRPTHDWDVATSASPETIAGIFPHTVLTGARYGTVTVFSQGSGSRGQGAGNEGREDGLPKTVEVTTFRTDGEYHDGRHPDAVEFVGNLDEDLSRRDFTMNSVAATADGTLIDPFGGIDDIKNRIIRCVGEPTLRYKEDSLRMFRAFRFSAELGFEIEPATLAAINENADRANLISAERVRIELEKTLMSQKPEITGEIIKAGLLETYKGRSTGSFENEALPPLARLSYLPSEPALRWCAFCAALMDAGLIQSCAAFLSALRLDAKTIKNASAGIAILPSLPEPKAAHIHSWTQIKRLLAKNGADAVRCAAAAADTVWKGHRSEVSVREPQDAGKTDERAASLLSLADRAIASGECFSQSGLAVSGQDLINLGYLPGPELGKALDKLLFHVIERPGDNNREKLLSILDI